MLSPSHWWGGCIHTVGQGAGVGWLRSLELLHVLAFKDHPRVVTGPGVASGGVTLRGRGRPRRFVCACVLCC